MLVGSSLLDEEILIVDNDRAIGDLLCGTCSDLGLHSTVYFSPFELLKEINQKKVFLVISGHNMPEMNGLNLCEEVKKLQVNLPFVLMSESIDGETASASCSVGVKELVGKPLNIEKIAMIIKQIAKERIETVKAEQIETKEAIRIFVDESVESLSDAAPLVLRLEELPIDKGVIDSLFRKVHSLKGGVGAIPGGKLVGSLAHELESVLANTKSGSFLPIRDAIDIFLEAVDLLIVLLKSIGEPLAMDVANQFDSTVRALAHLNGNPNFASDSNLGGRIKKKYSENDDVVIEDEGVWVSNEKLDAFMALSGELIVLKNHFHMLIRNRDISVDQAKLEKKHSDFAYSLNKITDHLQEHIMSVRKVSLEKEFRKIERVARETALEVKKSVKIITEGLKLGVDKNIAHSLSSCLVHIVRNSIDHGIETVEKRKVLGKEVQGTIVIKASESRGTIYLSVCDDGAGILKEKVIARAIQNGLINADAAALFTESEILDLIFLPGFTTAEKVTAVSGRGVGMDVVRSSVISHGGRVFADSIPGQGVKIHIEIPVPKAVMVEQTVLGSWNGNIFAVPLVGVARIASCDSLILSEIERTRVCQFEGRSVVLRSFQELLEGNNIDDEKSVRTKSAVFLKHKRTTLGLIVDKIEDQHEAVVRPFDSIIKSLPGFKGTAVLGNEQIAYVVSIEEMVSLLGNNLERSLVN